MSKIRLSSTQVTQVKQVILSRTHIQPRDSLIIDIERFPHYIIEDIIEEILPIVLDGLAFCSVKDIA